MNRHELHVLLIEDNLDDVALTLRILKKNHFIHTLHVVNDGAAALSHIFGGKEGGKPCLPKLILLDLKLPKVDGLEVLRALKMDERTKNIPVVVLTSSGEERDLEECYKLGVNSYVVKPAEFDEFTLSVAELGAYWLQRNKTPEWA
jgi:two-component system, response regulator